jgi:hypothetical protein
MEGEAPRIQDDFEKYKKQQHEWTTGNPYLASLRSVHGDAAKPVKIQ